MLWNLKHPVFLCSCKVIFSMLQRRENSDFSVRFLRDGRIALVEIMLWRLTGIPGWIGQTSGGQVTVCRYLPRYWPARFSVRMNVVSTVHSMNWSCNGSN